MGIRISEHKTISITFTEDPSQDKMFSKDGKLLLYSENKEAYLALQSKFFKKDIHRFKVAQVSDGLELSADYCIGIGHLGATGRYLQVVPKLNKKSAASFEQSLEEEQGTVEAGEDKDDVEIDYLKMLLDVVSVPEAAKCTEGLLQIDWDEAEIVIESKDDQLTPMLVVQFLNILQGIVRKGLRKSYYNVTENLNSRVKGKILVGEQIKRNVFRNKFTYTYCSYETFGIDSAENRLLKKALQFTISYVENFKDVFQPNYNDLQQMIAYCRAAFETIGNEVEDHELRHIKANPFFKEYKDGIRLAHAILKRFAYNISQTTQQKIATPPFWIDMPRLFELYVYSKMVEHNPRLEKHIHFQFATYGNALDILVSDPKHQMVIDAKYKLHYQNGHIHDDIRQVAGYARLKKVRKKLNIDDDDDRNIDCLIIYPDLENGEDSLSLKNLLRNEIKPYHKVYKLGLKLP